LERGDRGGQNGVKMGWIGPVLREIDGVGGNVEKNVEKKLKIQMPCWMWQ
jgi:hypothetical protein